jgi:putative ABC transport system substrate-binding protein
VLLVFLVLGLLATPLAAEAQQAARVHRIGYISMRSGPADNVPLDGFQRGLRELGYLEGRDVVLEIRYAGAGTKTLSDLATELVRLKVDVIVASSGLAAVAARKATRTIPIVMGASGDAVEQGLVASLARPGGNVTGLT